MAIKARFYCVSVRDQLDTAEEPKKIGEQVFLAAVYSSDPDSPNYKWSEATPYGQFEMFISNPAAFGGFVPNKEYELTLEPVYPPS